MRRSAAYSEEFLRAVGDRKFRNPETGNDVAFQSLPDVEQQRVFKQWSSQKDKPEAKPKAKKKPTFDAARKEVFSALKSDGWTLKEGLKTPQATKRVGMDTVILHFKPQALWVETKGKHGGSDSRSMWVDIRDVAHDAEKWTKDELPKLVQHFTKVKMASMERASYEGNKWRSLPKGWTDESREKFWNSLTSGSPKHKVTACIKKMDGKVDNPGAFCASLADRVLGKGWRSEARKKKAATIELLAALREVYSGLASSEPAGRDLLASRADEEWIGLEEMATLCPPCEKRMRTAGLSKVRVSVLRKILASRSATER